MVKLILKLKRRKLAAFDFSSVGRKECFDDQKVVAFDAYIILLVEVNGFRLPRHERGPARRLKQPDRVALSRSGERIPLRPRIDLVPQSLPEFVEIDLPFRENLWK